MITASALERLAICPASGVLPGVRVANAAMSRGSAVHSFLEDCAGISGSRDRALLKVAPENFDLCAAIDFSRLPFVIDGAGVYPEMAYAYNVATGEGRFIGQGVGRNYGTLAATEIAGTMDILMQEQGHIEVWDWKVGFGIDLLAPPPERNQQLRFYALAAARATGFTSARIGRIRIDEDGTVRPDKPAELDAFDLDDIADEVGRIHATVLRAREDLLTGRTPHVTPSAHCRYCPAFASCPAQTALIRQVVAAPQEVEREVAALLTPENARAAYERIKLVAEVVKRAEAAVYAYAARSPIDLGEGLVLGTVETSRESISGDVALPVLRELYGEYVADAACEVSTSKTRIRDALRGFAHRTGGKVARLEREALAALREAGAVETKRTETVKEHRR